MQNNLPAWGLALAACAPLLAAAQAANTELPKQSPQLSYQSAFDGYRPYKEAPLANWRELNAKVAGVPGGSSGHAGHPMDMRGMEMPPTPEAPASGAKQKSVPMHDGHHMKGGKP